LPIVLSADRVTSRPDQDTQAEGRVEFRRGGLSIQAERLRYDAVQDLASASGGVTIRREGAIYRGPELQLQVQRFEGFFLQPEFELPLLGSGGRAERVDFLDSTRTRARRAEYTSCPRPAEGDPAWVLVTRSVELDLERNEGRAEGAVLRFLGTPILALPTLSFPLGDERKSGWLPPSINIDNRSGLELSLPWYWNIAPNRDATLAPRLITRRGLGLDTEFRYLEARHEGAVEVEWLPRDEVAGRGRHAVQWQHESRLPMQMRLSVAGVRVSDNDWWKDFPDAGRGETARLLPLRASLERRIDLGAVEGLAYARTVKWQLLQDDAARIAAPYERSPQLGVRAALGGAAGWQIAAEAEYNRFELPRGEAELDGRPTGSRVHVLASVAHAWRDSATWLVPRLSLNAARYDTVWRDATVPARPRIGERAVPSFSLDAGLVLERRTEAFGRALQQTLEPRLLVVQTPFREQSALPNYDAAAKDFNFSSIYTDNLFSGVDRVSDANQLTAGFTTRLVDAASGVEALRLGLVQRMLFRTQRLTAAADGSPSAEPLRQRFSDVLALGSTSVLPGWTLDGAVQYSPEIKRSVRSIVGARYSPGPFRTVGTTYRLARGFSEQLELGWQWPVWKSATGPLPGTRLAGSASGGRCEGTWYSVGRVNYSLKDSRITDSVLGLEYDAGCWIGRFVAERVSTGRRAATTRLLLQLELVGLSRIGSNPLRVLKDNIPGYQLLREERRARGGTEDWQP
jgi:LPS-assembly protein